MDGRPDRRNKAVFSKTSAYVEYKRCFGTVFIERKKRKRFYDITKFL